MVVECDAAEQRAASLEQDKSRLCDFQSQLEQELRTARSVLIEKDMTAEDERLHSEVTKNTEFRIKYPRGELGQSSQDIEQFMLIEDLYKTVDRMQEHLDSMANNKINIEFLSKQMEKAQKHIEDLKDADREIVYKNGNGEGH